MSSCWELDPLLTDTFLVQSDNEDRDMSHEDMFDWDSYSNDQPYMNDGSIEDQGALTSRKETPGNGQQTYQDSIVPGTDDAWMLKETCSDANTDHPVPSRFAESMPLAPPSMDYCQQSLIFHPYQNTPYGFDSMYPYSPGPTDFSYLAEPPYTNSISSSARTSATLSSTDRQHGDVSSTAKPVERCRSPISDATRSKGRGARLGHPVSSETRAKIAAYRTGRNRSAATRAKMAANSARSKLFHVKRLHEQNFTFAGESVSSVEVQTFQAVHDVTGYGRKAIRYAIKDRNGVLGGKWVVTCLGRSKARGRASQNLLEGVDITPAELSRPRSEHDQPWQIHGYMPSQSSQVQGSGRGAEDWYQVSDMSYLHTTSDENSFGAPHLQDPAYVYEVSDISDTVGNRDAPVVPAKSRQLRHTHCSEATSAKIRAAASNRAPKSEATKAKMRKAALNRPPRAPHSEATKAKMRVSALKRGPVSEATRANMRVAALNRAPVSKAS